MSGKWKAAVLALALALPAVPSGGQVYQKNLPYHQGQLLDRSPQVGSGGYNVGSAYGAYGTFVRDNQLWVTGQVTGLAYFHGPIGYTSSDQLQMALPSSSLSSFMRQSVGLGDVLSGSTIAPTPYFDPSRTVLKLPAIATGLAAPGTNAPLVPTVDASVRATLSSSAYVEALAEYRQVLPTLPGRALSSPLMNLPAAVYAPPEAEAVPPAAGREVPYTAPEQFMPGRGKLFQVLGEVERTRLGQEFYELVRPIRPIDMSVRTAYGAWEPNYARSADPNYWRSMRNVPLRPAEANAVLRPVPRENIDVFMDLLERLRQRREGTAAERPQAPGVEPAEPLVDLTLGGAIVIRSLAGRGRDLANRNLAEAAAKLKAGKFYEAAEAYEMAFMLNPQNPLPRVGRGLAFFGAGEPLSAAQEIRAAIEIFPPLMEAHLDVRSLMDHEVFKARLADLDQRLAQSEEGRDTLLAFLGCFLHHNEVNAAVAKQYAREVQAGPSLGKVVQAFTDYVLTGKRPQAATQPAPAPAPTP